MATILVVDDLAGNRRALVELLSREGHQAIEAADGLEGLAAVQASRPDLVITDVLMPVVDGYEFVRRLRLDPTTSGIPVLFYTAPYGEREARELARSSGVPYVLTKPANPDEVLKIVGLVLARPALTDMPSDALLSDLASSDEQLQLLTDQLSETVEDLRIANARLRALINIGLEFASQRASLQRLQSLCVAAHDLFGATYVTIGAIDRDDRTVRYVVGSGVDVVPWIKAGDALSGVLKKVVDERRTLQGHEESDSAGGRFPHGHPTAKSYLIAPIASRDHVYGWIALVGNEGRAFAAEERQVLALAGHVGRIFELEHEVTGRQQAESALGRSERLNRTLLEHLPHRILVKDRHSVVTFCNANYARDLGLHVDQIIGKDAFALHAEALAEAHDAEDQRVMSDGKTLSTEEHYEIDGQERWVHTVKVPYRDEDGQVTGVLAVFEDITERHELERQFQQSQKMEAIGRLAGGVAHDFNNLLTAILGYCELLNADLDPDDRHRADVLQIQQAGLTAAGLTRQLLAFSRREIIAPTTLDLNVVVADMRVLLGRLIREDVQIVLGLGPDLAPVTFDRGQVEQVVLNLAINARDAMPGGGTVTIATANVEHGEDYTRTDRSLKTGSYVALEVSDTGGGMTPDVQARVFEPFFTTKPRGQGTGLGLASVHGIMARTGGGVEVVSEIGRGTTFKVYFPRADAAAVIATAPQPSARTPTGSERVLVVEDADGLRSLTSRLLTQLGYTVLVAANAAEALQVFHEASIDVLLTDVVMPGASGPQLTRELVERQPGLKVLYMSGYTEDSIVQQGILLPGVAFLNKPFSADTLGRKIRAVLDN